MTSREKVLWAERQVRDIAAGEKDTLYCPFCGLGTTSDTNFLCCDEMATVTHAVLDHIEHIGRAEAVERLLERLDKAQGALLN